MYLICGEALYDVFVDPTTADARRQVSLSAKAGGSPHNVAIGLARLGCAVALATEIAPDTLGRSLEKRLQTEGVDCRFVRRTAKATPLAMVDVDNTGTPRYAFHGLDKILFHPDITEVKRLWKSIVGIHVGSIPIVSTQSASHLLEMLAAAPERVLISFDPNVRLAIESDAGRWRDAVDRFRKLAHIIKVSEEDIMHMYGTGIDNDALGRSWLSSRCSLVVLTRGARGATFFARSGSEITIPAIPVVVADTVGAGDSFQAAMLAWLAEQRHASPVELSNLSADGLRTMGHFAMRAAATTCRYRGPEFPYRKALDASPN